MTQDEIIALAKRVGFPIQHPEWRKAVEEFAALVKEQAIAKERESYFHTIGPNEMSLKLVREYNGEFLHYAHKFNANLVMDSLVLPSVVATKAKIMSVEIEAAIKARGQA